MAKKSNASKRSGKAAGRRKLSPEAAAYLPRPDFPLSPHLPTRRWYKVIRGKRYYFGKLDDPDAALKAYLGVRDELEAGLTPAAWKADTSITVADVANKWLAAKDEAVAAGDIKEATFAAYYKIVSDAVGVLGRNTPAKMLRPEQFRKLATKIKTKQAPTAAAKSLTVVRMMFAWAYDEGLLEAPVRTGSGFKLPRKAEKRAAARRRGNGIYTAEQLRLVLDAAEKGVEGVRPSNTLRAILLLGINGGMTQMEIAGLRVRDVDLKAGLIDHDRDKTGVRRTVPLWPETVEAIRAAMTERKGKPGVDDLLLVTTTGKPWVVERFERVVENGRDVPRVQRIDAVHRQFARLCKAKGVRVEGASFGHLRHTFRTVADEVGDQHAIHRIMAHSLPGMSDVYVREISIDRLRAVTDHVHQWLYGDVQ
jgi:integrase